jgi:translation initiation factor 6
MITKMYFKGIPFIGAFGCCLDSVTMIMPNLGKKAVKVQNVLKTPVIETTIGKSGLLGIFATGNSSGVVVPYFLEDQEKSLIEEHIQVLPYLGKHTAIGNLVLANDKGCIISPLLDRKFFQDALDSEVVCSTLGGYQTVGSVGVVTNRAGMLHPDLSDEDIAFVEEILHISCARATANKGVGYMRLCLLANSQGAIVGGQTTGPELVHIEDILEG